MEGKEIDTTTLEEMVEKAKKALSRKQNTSAHRPDSISCRFFKRMKDTIQGEKLLEKVARNLIKGSIP